MATENQPYHFNYQALDKFLCNEFDPKELGNQLDEMINDLVYLARNEDDFGRALSYHCFTLRKLRDIFWWKLTRRYSRENCDEPNPNPSSHEQNT